MGAGAIAALLAALALVATRGPIEARAEATVVIGSAVSAAPTTTTTAAPTTTEAPPPTTEPEPAGPPPPHPGPPVFPTVTATAVVP